MVSEKNLVWLDLEMTGLDPERDTILEIATVVTDGELRELAVGPCLAVHQSEETLSRMGPWCVEQHGRSGLTERLTDLLHGKALFTDVLYLEGRHTSKQTPAEYLGAWRSVNDLQVQLGPELFKKFLDYVTERTAGLASIDTTFLTRAWAARRA